MKSLDKKGAMKTKTKTQIFLYQKPVSLDYIFVFVNLSKDYRSKANHTLFF